MAKISDCLSVWRGFESLIDRKMEYDVMVAYVSLQHTAPVRPRVLQQKEYWDMV